MIENNLSIMANIQKTPAVSGSFYITIKGFTL